MKTVCILLLVILLLHGTSATAQRSRARDSVEVTIRLHTRNAHNARVDSVFVIFDRYDLSGAGVVKRIFYPVNNQITIPAVPEGRYYISIFCMGIHQQFFNDLTFINKKRSNQLEFNLSRSEVYIPGTFIPAFNIDFSRLAITDYRSFRPQNGSFNH